MRDLTVFRAATHPCTVPVINDAPSLVSQPLPNIVGKVIEREEPLEILFVMTTDPMRDSAEKIQPCHFLADVSGREMHQHVRFEAEEDANTFSMTTGRDSSSVNR